MATNLNERIMFNERIMPMDFHSCDTPRGMNYFNIDVLTSEQKQKLNNLKINMMRENETYLATHPQIRAIVSIITRLVLRRRPRSNFYKTIAEYFSKSRIDIESDIDDYIKTRAHHQYGAVSALKVWPEHSKSYISVYEDDDELEDGILHDLSYSTASMQTQSFHDFESDGLQAIIPDSMINLDVDLEKIKQVLSGTIIQSISEVTQTAECSGGHSKVRIAVPECVSLKSGALDDGGKQDQQEGNEESVSHSSTIEDSDVSYDPENTMRSLILKYLLRADDECEDGSDEYSFRKLNLTETHHLHHLHLREVTKNFEYPSDDSEIQTTSTSEYYDSSDVSKDFDSSRVSQEFLPLVESYVKESSGHVIPESPKRVDGGSKGNVPAKEDTPENTIDKETYENTDERDLRSSEFDKPESYWSEEGCTEISSEQR